LLILEFIFIMLISRTISIGENLGSSIIAMIIGGTLLDLNKLKTSH